MRTVSRILMIAPAVVAMSCSSSDRDIVGVWRGAGVSLEITRSGELYTVKADNSSLNGTFAGRYQDAVLRTNAPLCPDIAHSSVLDKIYFCGKELSRPPLDLAEPPANATTTRSGIAMKVLQAGSGTRHPTMEDRVTIDFAAWPALLSEITWAEGGTPRTVKVSELMPGIAEAVQLMVAGESRRLWIPGPLAIENMTGGLPGVLVVDLQLKTIS